MTTEERTQHRLLDNPKLTVRVTGSGIYAQVGRKGIAWWIEFDERGRFSCAYRADLRDGEVGTLVRKLSTVLDTLGA